MKYVDPRHDPWRSVGGEDGLPAAITPAPHLLLTVTQWRAVRERWPAGTPLGVTLANDVDVAWLRDDLPRFELVALQFPKWTDGRAYSQAHLLRSRLRYGRELRATGEVLVDMLPLLQRTGFDAVALRSDQRQDAAEHALGYFRDHYQGDALDRKPLFASSPGRAQAGTRESLAELAGAGEGL